jgi:polar amino acid transport system substrate-binding protein
MKKLFALLLVGILGLLACSAPASSAKLRILMPDSPPYNYIDEKGQAAGAATEVVRAVMQKLGQDIPIEVMLWDQAYALALKGPNVALFSTARIPSREDLFLWVGPIQKSERYLYAKKGSGIKLNNIDDIKAGTTVAGVKEDSGTQYCLAHGCKLVYAETDEIGLQKVVDGSADIVSAPADISYVAKRAGVNPDNLERVLFAENIDLYIAFSKNTPASIVQQWQQALDSIKK